MTNFKSQIGSNFQAPISKTVLFGILKMVIGAYLGFGVWYLVLRLTGPVFVIHLATIQLLSV